MAVSAGSPRPGRRGRTAARATLGSGTARSRPAMTAGRDRDQLQQRQRRGGLEVEQVRGEQVDLGLDRGVPQPPRVSTTPNEVAQNRNTTLADDTIAGRSAGRVTVRNTWNGLAPSAAAASPGRGSSDAQAAPTAGSPRRR